MERKRKGREREKRAASSQSIARRRHSGMSPCIGSAPLRSFKETAANPTNRAEKPTRIRSVLPTDLPPNLICISNITRVCLIDQNQSEQLSNTTFCTVMCLLSKINRINFYKVLILLKNPSIMWIGLFLENISPFSQQKQVQLVCETLISCPCVLYWGLNVHNADIDCLGSCS